MPRKSKKAQAAKVSWQQRKNNTDSGSADKPTTAKELMAIEPENSMEVMMSPSHDPVTCVLASYSQDHPKYADSRNSQCAANSATFLAFLQETDNVTSAHLDLVLDRGNELYVATVAVLKAERRYEHPHLATDEIPSIVNGLHKQHVLIKYQSMYGLFNSAIADVAFMMLCDGLQCLVSEVNYALLVMNSLFIAVFRNQQGRYGYFDPHARERDGLPPPSGAPHGTAVMMLFTCLNDLIDKLIQVFTLAGAAPTTQYELMPVSFQPIDNASDREMATDAESPLMTTHNDDAMLSQSAAEMTQRMVTGESRPCASKRYESIGGVHDNSKVVCTQQKQTRDVLKIVKSKRKKFQRRTQAHKIIDNAMARVAKQETRRINANLRKKESYSQTPEIRQRKKSYIVTRYQQDPNFRVKQKLFAVDRYCKHDTIKMKQRSYSKQKYSHDDEYRAKKCYSVKQKYSHNVEYRTKKCSYIHLRYGRDDQFRDKQRSYIKQRYGHDDTFRNKQRSYIKQRYGHDDTFRNKQRSYIKQRYGHDDTFRNKQRSYIKQRYGHDDEFRRKQRSYIKERYAQDPAFRAKQKENMSLRWKAKHDSSTRTTAMKLLQKYKVINRLCKERNDHAIMKAVALFQALVKNGPTFVCTVCHRALFPNQVRQLTKYKKNKDVVASCLTRRFVHICNRECNTCCKVPDERKMEWICHTCHAHLKDGKMPALAVSNNLQLADIPTELCDLNILERHLVSKCISFAKIVPLPKGQQRAIRGNVVCVPSEVEETVNVLPRLRSRSQVLRVKLKRRLCYKGHQIFQTVTWSKLMSALIKLKQIHPQYRNITIRDDADLCDPTLTDDESSSDEDEMNESDYNEEDLEAIHTFERDALCELNSDSQNDARGNVQQQQCAENVDEGDAPNGGVILESCLQPNDVSEEIMSFTQGIYCVAPAERNNPVSFFRTPKLEAMAFPVQFPTGKNTLDEERQVKVTPSKYFKTRLCCVDERFARDTNYLFFAQFVIEIYLATSSMRIQLRKGKPFTRDGRRINNAMLQDKREVEKLVHSKDAVRFMTPLRGTPAYWERTTKDLFAMIRQLGTPTFFCTFSAAEMRWEEVITAIKAQQGEVVDFAELDWATKCEILRSNPVTTMRMFDKRVEALFRDLILSPARPIGEVVDYFYRLEFQHRGSPHIHCLIWVKDAPVFEEASEGAICDFVSRYISAQLPDPEKEPELYKKVTEVQMHSKGHTKTCVKHQGANCRFGFPRPPCETTMIITPVACENQDQHKEKQVVANDKLVRVQRLLNEPETSSLTLPQLLAKCELTDAEYVECLYMTASKSSVVLKRDPKDCWVNNYNRHLLLAWDANLDIQYILNAFSCISYICSYISKAEHGLSQYLKSVIENSRNENVNESDEMKQIMQAYSKKREVSAQECVARACSLHMKQSSRSVVFVQTSDNPLKMSYPLSLLEGKTQESHEVWMTGLPDKYKSRPQTKDFEVMCLADFASTCRIVYGKQVKGKNVLPLLNDMGFVQKRKEKAAVIKYCKFSEQKNPEEYYCSLLKLYLPHRANCQLKSERCPSYQLFHDHACVQLPYNDSVERVCEIVNRNRERYEKHSKDIDDAIQEVEESGLVINEWCHLAPESELQRLECIEENNARDEPNDNVEDNVPDYNVRSETSEISIATEAAAIDPAVLRDMYRNLNQKQASVFYKVRDWCIKRVCSSKPIEQFFYHINGGAGTGKSHLIKCIYTEATKILQRLPRLAEEADISKQTVVLAAFTGTAAFNISGTTLHCLLKLPRSLKPPYHGLGNKLDEVRAELSIAQILIIDEISMVSKDLFAYVNARLIQIKGINLPFGGMSVLAVGDFFQLPPVRQSKPLCVYDPTRLDHWRDNFKKITLTAIMRQKDDVAFAELLNRLRVKEKSDELSELDRALLATRYTSPEMCPSHILHVFATNKQVDGHNSAMLDLLHKDIVQIDADDYKKDKQTGRMARQTFPVQGAKSELPDSIRVALGARVMLTRNFDVQAGLCNGTFGKIVELVNYPNEARVKKVGLELDHVSNTARAANRVYIDRQEEKLKKPGVTRRQFPIKLAFACTIHKVQGMTTSEAAVSLKGVFEHGMGYVALSRVTSLSGLHILHMDERRLHANPEITAALAEMAEDSLESVMPLLHVMPSVDRANHLVVVHHNTEGLSCHVQDIRCHHELHFADVLCFTETHLQGSVADGRACLEGFTMFHRNRRDSYTNCPDLATKLGGGVGICVKSHIAAQEKKYIQGVTDIEFVVVKLEAPLNVLIAAVYRPPGNSLRTFLPSLGNLLRYLEVMDHHQILVCGDFNEDMLSASFKPILDLFRSTGYTQLITTATTDKNTLLDLIFVSRPQCALHSGVLQTYYSYHNPVFCVLATER
ncbi:uncharacterized protein ACBT44_004651 isoform 1-T2 [Syngnathus typhle]